MRKLRNILNHVLDVLAGVSFLAMVALTCWQVFTRYILKIHLPGLRSWYPICLRGCLCLVLPSLWEKEAI